MPCWSESPLGALAVDLEDFVAGEDARLVRGASRQGTHHGELIRSLGHADLHADAAELLVEQFLELLDVQRRNVGGVFVVERLIEPVEHSLDGALEQFVLVHFLQIPLVDLVHRAGQEPAETVHPEVTRQGDHDNDPQQMEVSSGHGWE